jgi:alpha-tubulin suppressor-like RCC1 family protein
VTAGVATTVAGLGDAVELAGDLWTVCARRTTGAVACWGDDTYGQLGDGTRLPGTPRDNPHVMTARAIAGIADATAIAAGESLACALRGGGRLTCWGMLQLPQGSEEPAAKARTPYDVIAAGVESIAIGRSHACARLADGRVQCWGANTHGELGDGSILASDTPLGVPGL